MIICISHPRACVQCIHACIHWQWRQWLSVAVCVSPPLGAGVRSVRTCAAGTWRWRRLWASCPQTAPSASNSSPAPPWRDTRRRSVKTGVCATRVWTASPAHALTCNYQNIATTSVVFTSSLFSRCFILNKCRVSRSTLQLIFLIIVNFIQKFKIIETFFNLLVTI